MTQLGSACDMVHLVSSYTTDEEKSKHLDKYAAEIVRMFTLNVLDKSSFISGTSQLQMVFEAMTDNDEKLIARALAQQTQGYLPYSSLGRFIGDGSFSHSKRKPQTVWEKTHNNYFNQGVGDYIRNVWGERQDIYHNIISSSTDYDNTPENEELARLAELGWSPNELQDSESDNTFKWSEFKREGYSQSLYSLMQRKMSETTINGKTLRESIRELVQSDEYQALEYEGTMQEAKSFNMEKWDRTDDTRINMIKDIFDEFKTQAKEEVLEEYGDSYFNADGVSANEIKDLQAANKEAVINKSRVNNTINDIRSFK